MARYNLIYDAEARLISIDEMSAKLPKGGRVVSTLVFPENGVAPSASEPNPRQHLTNVATMIQVPFEELTIVNNTENSKLDELEKSPKQAPGSARRGERQVLSSTSPSRTSSQASESSEMNSEDGSEDNSGGFGNGSMDHDGDGKAGGSLSGDQSTAHKGAVARHEREAEEAQEKAKSQGDNQGQPEGQKIEETTS